MDRRTFAYLGTLVLRIPDPFKAHFGQGQRLHGRRRKQPNRTKETDREEGNYPRRTV